MPVLPAFFPSPGRIAGIIGDENPAHGQLNDPKFFKSLGLHLGLFGAAHEVGQGSDDGQTSPPLFHLAPRFIQLLAKSRHLYAFFFSMVNGCLGLFKLGVRFSPQGGELLTNLAQNILRRISLFLQDFHPYLV